MRVFYFCIFSALSVLAHPNFRFRIPNGERIPCPVVDGVVEEVGCVDGWREDMPKRVCPGIGHRTCSGGSLPLNAFGTAWADAGFEWTKELCEADSDGDGKTNGEELGDKYCVWRKYDVMTEAMGKFDVSY